MIFFNFFLKRKFGLSERVDVILALFILHSICMCFILSLFSESQLFKIIENFEFNWINLIIIFSQLPIFFIPFLFSYGIINSFLETLREKIPYKKEKIIEAGKEYEVHYYPVFNLKKYYHNGKLHREKEAAYVAISENCEFSGKKFYLFGNEVKKEDFEKTLLKNKVVLF
tara:strand:+ start:17862 stop:18371 length:510 start_codon:yes stop_codon:yes gene_type:complete